MNKARTAGKAVPEDAAAQARRKQHHRAPQRGSVMPFLYTEYGPASRIFALILYLFLYLLLCLCLYSFLCSLAACSLLAARGAEAYPRLRSLTFFRIPRTAAAPSAAPSVNGMCQNCTWDRDIFHIVRASCGRLFFYVPESLLEGSPSAAALSASPEKTPTAQPAGGRAPPRSGFSDRSAPHIKTAAFSLPWESVFVFFFDGPDHRTPFCRLRTPQPDALPPGKGHKPGLAAAPTHFVHSLYTSRTKKAQ